MYVAILPARGILYCYAGKPVILKVTIVNIFTRQRKKWREKKKEAARVNSPKSLHFGLSLRLVLLKLKKYISQVNA